jgi:hypothetical protein
MLARRSKGQIRREPHDLKKSGDVFVLSCPSATQNSMCVIRFKVKDDGLNPAFELEPLSRSYDTKHV